MDRDIAARERIARAHEEPIPPPRPPPDHGQPTPRRGEDVEVPSCPRCLRPLYACPCGDNELRK